MNSWIVVLAGGLELIASLAAAPIPPPPDARFVTQASIGNALEIQESILASERAADPKLKDFAKMMIADHQTGPAARPKWEKHQMRHYIALIHKDADSDYGVSFPDLPGVISAGSNVRLKNTAISMPTPAMMPSSETPR